MLTKIMMVSSFLSVLTTSGALAASYCAVFAWGKQCDYVTYDECLRAAGSHGGCEINSQEDKTVSGTAPFCLVSPYVTKCIFDDAAACRMAASIENSELIKQAGVGSQSESLTQTYVIPLEFAESVVSEDFIEDEHTR